MVPMASDLAQKMQQDKEAKERERQEIKRLVMQVRCDAQLMPLVLILIVLFHGPHRVCNVWRLRRPKKKSASVA